MAVTEQQEKSGKLLFGEALYTKLIGGAEDKTKKLEEAGVDNKSVETPEVQQVAGLTKEELVTELQPFIEAMNLLAEKLGEQGQQIQSTQDELKQLKIAEAVKQQTQTPRAQLFTLQRATEAQKTILSEDDPLLKQQPQQTPVKGQSGAAHFFPQQ